MDNLAGLGGSAVGSPKYKIHTILLADILPLDPNYLQSKYL